MNRSTLALRRAAGALGLLILLFSTTATAQTWTGGGANNNWTTAGNWFANNVPANNGTANVAFGGTARLTPFVDTNDPWSIQSLTFNSGTGAFTFSGNTLQVGNTSNGSGLIANYSSNVETFNDGVSTAVSQFWTAASGPLVFNGAVTISGSNSLTVNGNQNTTFNGAVTGNTLVCASLGAITVGGNTDNTGLSVTANTSITYLAKNSSATVHAVDTALTLNGGEVILAGTGGDQIADTAVATINSGTLDMDGQSETIGALNGTSGVIANSQTAASTLTVTGGGAFGGTIINDTGQTSLLVGGTAPLILTGANTYTGNTTIISGATLQLGNATTSNGSIVTSVTDNGTLLFANPNSQTYAGTISGGGGITKTGAGTLTLPHANSYSGATEINNGTVVIPSDGQLNSIGQIDIGSSGVSGDNGTLTIDGGGSLTQTAGFFNIVAFSGSHGTLNVGTTTNGATVTTGSNGIFAGRNGTINIGWGSITGTLTANGGVFVDGGVLQTANSGSALVLASGQNTHPLSDNLIVAAGGRASIAGNFTLNNQSVAIEDPNSKMETLAGGALGVVGGATINVFSGGLLSTSGTLYVGTGFPGKTGTGLDGTVVVDGPGSKLMAPGGVTIGDRGFTGVLTFQNFSTGNVLGDVSVAFSFYDGSAATMSVLSGSTITAMNDLFVLSGFGNSQSATFSVDGTGSAVTLNPNADVFIGGSSSSDTAVVNVSNNAVFTVGVGGTTILRPNGVININGGVVDLKSLTYYGGTINLNSGSLSFIGSFNVGVGGALGQNLTLDSSKSLTLTGTTTIDQFKTLTLSGGTLSTGDLVNNGTFNFTSGTLGITGAGGLTIGSGGALGSVFELGSGRTLNVTNATTVNSGALLVLDGGGAFTSGSLVNNGEVDLNGATATAGGGTVNNSGLIHGTGKFTSSVANNAGGEIRAEPGQRITFAAANGVNLGAINMQGGTAEFSQILFDNGGGQINGHGTLIVPAGHNTGLGASPQTSTFGLTITGIAQFSGGDTDVYGSVDLLGLVSPAGTIIGPGSGKVLIGAGGNTVTFYGDVWNNGNTFHTAAGSYAVFFGTVHGASSFSGGGTVDFEGTYLAGNSPAQISIAGNAIVGAGAALDINLGGTAPGNGANNYAQVNVTGTATLGGTLNLIPYNSFVPVSGDKFTVMTYANESGTFSSITGTSPAPGLTYEAVYQPTSVVIITTTNGDKTWGVDASGNASLGSNWIGGIAPGGIGDSATFSTIITAPRTVTLDTDTTVGSLKFDSPNSYTITGSHTLTLQAAGSAASTIKVSGVHGNGAHAISVPVTLASNLNVEQNSAGALTLSGALNDAAGKQVNVSGSGTLRFALTSPGAAAIGAGVTATVNSSATLEMAGTVSALSSGANRVNITNNSTAAAGILVSGTHQVVGVIDGSGNTQVNAGSDLTANRIIQNALIIGGTAGSLALVTIDASDPSGNPLGQSSGLALVESATPSGPIYDGVISSANLSSVAGRDTDLMPLSAGNSAVIGNASPVPEPPTLLLALLAVLGVISIQFVRDGLRCQKV